jgi:hypothetical protein
MSLNLLVERLPIFRRPYRPLKIGIHRDIMALEVTDELCFSPCLCSTSTLSVPVVLDTI